MSTSAGSLTAGPGSIPAIHAYGAALPPGGAPSSRGAGSGSARGAAARAAGARAPAALGGGDGGGGSPSPRGASFGAGFNESELSNLRGGSRVYGSATSHQGWGPHGAARQLSLGYGGSPRALRCGASSGSAAGDAGDSPRGGDGGAGGPPAARTASADAAGAGGLRGGTGASPFLLHGPGPGPSALRIGSATHSSPAGPATAQRRLLFRHCSGGAAAGAAAGGLGPSRGSSLLLNDPLIGELEVARICTGAAQGGLLLHE